MISRNKVPGAANGFGICDPGENEYGNLPDQMFWHCPAFELGSADVEGRIREAL